MAPLGGFPGEATLRMQRRDDPHFVVSNVELFDAGGPLGGPETSSQERSDGFRRHQSGIVTKHRKPTTEMMPTKHGGIKPRQDSYRAMPIEYRSAGH